MRKRKAGHPGVIICISFWLKAAQKSSCCGKVLAPRLAFSPGGEEFTLSPSLALSIAFQSRLRELFVTCLSCTRAFPAHKSSGEASGRLPAAVTLQARRKFPSTMKHFTRMTSTRPSCHATEAPIAMKSYRYKRRGTVGTRTVMQAKAGILQRNVNV